jgi:hypothetical protein
MIMADARLIGLHRIRPDLAHGVSALLPAEDHIYERRRGILESVRWIRVRRVIRRHGVPVAVFLPLAAILASCGGGQSTPTGSVGTSGGTVSSSGGTAVLTVPAGALSRPTAIRVTPGSTSAWPSSPLATDPVVAYDLAPSGLHFTQPAQLVVRLPASDVIQPDGIHLPLALSQDGATVQPLPTSVQVDQHKRTVILTATVAHFSTVKIGTLHATATFSPDEVTANVGDPPWTVHVTLSSRQDRTGSITSLDATGIGYTAYAPVKLSGLTTHPDISIPVGKSASLDDSPPTFDCAEVGGGGYAISMGLVARGAPLQVGNLGFDGTAPLHIDLVSDAICNPKGTTTTTSSTTTTSTTVVVPPPTIYPSAISAYFDQGAFSTYYTEPVYDPTWTYKWSVSIPTDPSCASGFKGSTPTPDKATWYHADTSEGGPCNHSIQIYSSVTGHPGTVTLVVTPKDNSWTCEMTFNGTAPQNQDSRTPAIGNNPQCQKP